MLGGIKSTFQIIRAFHTHFSPLFTFLANHFHIYQTNENRIHIRHYY
jgi:hypothetical protein